MSPPPGFEKVSPMAYLSDLSTDSETDSRRNSHLMIQLPPLDTILQPLPVKLSWIKREQRGTFTEEEVSSERHFGEIKFYQLKKRFGFISLDIDKSDIFLCEDDIVISKINMKKFKEIIFKKIPLRLSFLIKKYNESNVEKRKAIEIELLIDDKN